MLPHTWHRAKKHRKKFGDIGNKPYLCSSYPENNLFTLRKTNTYWRFGAVACEGHRFFLFLYPSTPLLAIRHSTIDNQAHRYRQSSTQPLTPKNSAIDNQQLTCPRFFKPPGKLTRLCRANFPDASGSHPHSYGYPSPTPRAAVPFVSGERPHPLCQVSSSMMPTRDNRILESAWGLDGIGFTLSLDMT